MLFLLACTSAGIPTDAGGAKPRGDHGPEVLPGDADAPADPEGLPGDTAAPEDDKSFFEVDGVHSFSLDIPDASWVSLLNDGRTYVPATFTADGATFVVGMRLKGNTTWQAITAKPAIIIDMNRYVEGQSLTGISSFYLHNMMYDPSMMHERLAFGWMREFGVAASRTTYVRLAVNGSDYGHYLAVEKENEEYLARWWADTSGSMYEAGSFNWPCDVNYAPGTCYEDDRAGTDEGRTALAELTGAAHAADEDWVAAIEAEVDLDAFLRTMAADLLVSHYDDYAWNINNYRIYHEPTVDRWYWTSWSTDLAFGWYPWMDGPHCGTYGQNVSDYHTGYMMGRCAAIPECEARWEAAVAEAADAFEAYDAPSRIDALYDQVKAEMQTDTRKSYSEADFEAEVSCMTAWSRQRPAQIRAQLP